MGQRTCVCMRGKSLQLRLTLFYPVDCSPPGSPIHGILHPWDSPGKNTRVGCRAFLHRIFLTQGWKLCLLHLPARAGGFFTTSTTWEAPTGQRTYASKSPSMGVFPVCLMVMQFEELRALPKKLGFVSFWACLETVEPTGGLFM